MLGLGTYAFFWQHSDRAPVRTELPQMLRRTRELDAQVFQICDYQPILGYTTDELRALRSLAEDLGVTLELGTRGIATSHLTKYLGICLDPANSVAALENPVDVIDRCATYVANMHVKDFAFTRRGGWVGFTLEGTQLETGLLECRHLICTVDPDARGINRIVEHWLTWRDTYEETCQVENEWNVRNLHYMRNFAH